jgi:aerobic-type carbon monoxide dehydrogenase small subunit (CoxS/CutS family)
MNDKREIAICLNGTPIHGIAEGSNLAAVLLGSHLACRRSASGETRAPFCGMGLCGECRVTVDGVMHVLACRTICRDGLQVKTS